ncbi:MAG: glycosyltransferase [Burkholderiaceae bacterium]|nr:glycosyltransferase [Burkholderiaceae bacterium]
MSARPAPPVTWQVLHATEHLAAGVLAFLLLATRELVQAGVQQTLVYSRRHDTPDDVGAQFDPRVRLVEVNGGAPAGDRWGGHWSFLRALREALCEELRTHRYDAVHLHAARAGLVGRLGLGRQPAATPPLFYSPHGLATLNRQRPLLGAMSSLAERVAGFRDCHPVGCGHGEARELERLTRRSAAVLENPVHEAFFDVQRRPDATPRVVTVGRACEQKGPTQFAELAARFHYAGEPVQFVWVGAGEPQVEQMLRAVGVEVTGWVGQDEVRAQLARARVYVQTSHWEGMPLSVLQAMAAGVPCVVTDVVGNRDAVTHGATGLLARDVSGLAVYVKSLLEQPQRARELGAAAQREARQRFHPERFRHALLSLYRFGAPDPRAPQRLADTSVVHG